MNRQFARGELVDRLLTELRGSDETPQIDQALREGFAQVILRRVDNEYFYRHRLTTLGSQLIDSAKWAIPCIPAGEISVRAFRPTEADHGYSLEGRIIETMMPDQPFIFDTMKLLLHRNDVIVHNSLSVIFAAKVTDDSKVSAIQLRTDKGARNISYTRWYVDWPAELNEQQVEKLVIESLQTSRAMVQDFHRMVRSVRDVAVDLDYLAKISADAADHIVEVRDFLEWLVQENFVFMGMSFYELGPSGELQVAPTKGLGSVRGSELPSGPSTRAILAFLEKTGAPIARVQKSVQESVVHRAGKVDEVIVRTADDQGEPWIGS